MKKIILSLITAFVFTTANAQVFNQTEYLKFLGHIHTDSTVRSTSKILVFSTANAAGYALTLVDANQMSPTHVIFTPATTDTVILVKNKVNVIAPAGTIAVAKIKFPSSPVDNDFIEVKFTKIVSSLAGINGTILGCPTAAAVGTYIKFVYDSATSTWY